MTSMTGLKSMLLNLHTKTAEDQKLAQAVISTLAFFALYEVPLSAKRVHELLLGYKTTLAEVERALSALAQSNKIIQSNNLFSTKPWNASVYNANQLELTKKWAKVDRYFGWLAMLPFVRGLSVINSLALGTADADSDIDFFVVTENNRLYFVRSVIIVLFRLLGVYKTRQKIKDKFCFGFFVTKDNLALQHLLLKPEDPYFVFWLANLRPILGAKYFNHLMRDNLWLRDYFPNFEPQSRLVTVKKPSLFIQLIKFTLEVILWIPATLAEPILRRIHINHTFKLAENNTANSTTIANDHMLKLHGYDVRADIATQYSEVLKNAGV